MFRALCPLRRSSRNFLKLLKEDEEFRYAVAGLIGYDEILRRLEGHDKKFNEILSRLEEHGEKFIEILKRLEEYDKRFLEIIRRLDGREEELKRLRKDFNRFIEIEERRWEEANKRFEAIQEILLRHGKAVESLQEAVRDLTRTVAAIGRRYGVVTEEAFRGSIRYLVEDLLKAYTASKWIYFDSEGIVFGVPSVIGVDVLIRDREHILLEYKAYADRGDVAELHKIGILYEKVVKVRPGYSWWPQ